jgi:predicted lactoylglutathione lyase
MPTTIFVNLPVKDLERSKQFFSKLGYSFNARFTDHNAACLVISDTICVMLLVEQSFKTFTSKPIVDATRGTEVLLALTAESREQVDQLVDKALAAGGTTCGNPMDHGFMYQRAFQDLDGHQWEILWLDPTAPPPH